jgi:hypothetical protein
MSAYLVEQDKEAYAQLAKIPQRYPDIEVKTYPGDFLTVLPTILADIPVQAFAFFFVDPKGWRFRLHDLAAMLQRPKSECASACAARRCRGTGPGRPRPRSQRGLRTADPLLCRLRFRSRGVDFWLGRLRNDDPVDAHAVGLGGRKREAKLLAHHAGKEPAD